MALPRAARRAPGGSRVGRAGRRCAGRAPPGGDCGGGPSSPGHVLVGELAELLGTSTRTIQRQLRAGTFFIAPLPQIDYHLRWSRERVYRAIADTHV